MQTNYKQLAAEINQAQHAVESLARQVIAAIGSADSSQQKIISRRILVSLIDGETSLMTASQLAALADDLAVEG